MDLEQVFHMNSGLGETSYAKNSSVQSVVISKAKPTLEKSVAKMYSETFPEWLRIADLGCSSGPNTLVVVSEILGTIDETRLRSKKKSPVFEIFLNDLHGNDFNTLFQSLPSFFETLEKEKGADFGPCFVAGAPGSFYGRLFPNNSMHIIHSSYSLHWLPKVPKGLVSDKGEALNKNNIYITSTSPPEVFKAYLDEFEESFASFLRHRSEEIVPGCAMVLTFMGRNNSDHPDSLIEVLGRAFNDMALEGIIEGEKVNHFNLPYYTPTASEVKKVIEEEGSFSLHELDSFSTDWDVGFGDELSNHDDEKRERARHVSVYIRAILEPILVAEFGEAIMTGLFERFTDKVMESMEKEKWSHFNLVISLTRNN